MDQSPSGAERGSAWRTSPWRLILQGIVRLLRLPLDVLFLTLDYLRFTLWVLLHARAPFLAARLTHFGPHATTDAIEVSGRRVRRCTLARKYGSPALLGLLLPGIFPACMRRGRAVWAWEQGSIQRPTTATRYISLGLALLLLWSVVAFVAVWKAPRDAVQQRLGRLSSKVWSRWDRAMGAFHPGAPPGPVGAATAKAPKPTPSSSSLQTQLGREYCARNRPQEALAAFSKAHREAPDEWSTQINLARMLACQNKELDLALDLAQKASKQAPTNPAVADTLGWIHVLRGEHDKAVRLMNFADVEPAANATGAAHPVPPQGKPTAGREP